MWRGRLLSQQQQQHVDTHTHTPTTIIFELAHLIKPLHVDLPLSLLQHQMFSLFSSHSSSSPPASPLMNFFIWRFPTDILIFQHHSLLHPPSSTHPLVSSLWFPFCTLQIWVRHPTSCVGGGVEGGGGGGGGGFLFRSHDRCTWFPSYQKAAAASRRHLLTSITAQQANHTKRGEHVRCLSLSDVQTEHKQHRLYLLWDDWDTLFFLSLSLSPFASSDLNFLNFLFTSSSSSLSNCLFSSFSPAPPTSELLPSHWQTKTPEALDHPSTDPPNPRHRRHNVLFGRFLLLVQKQMRRINSCSSSSSGWFDDLTVILIYFNVSF